MQGLFCSAREVLPTGRLPSVSIARRNGCAKSFIVLIEVEWDPPAVQGGARGGSGNRNGAGGPDLSWGDAADVDTMVDSVMDAQTNLSETGIDVEIEEAAADKGYHATDTLELAESLASAPTSQSRSEKESETGRTYRKRSVVQ
jgi:hypothetical protein